jgi:hypothetical protein
LSNAGSAGNAGSVGGRVILLAFTERNHRLSLGNWLMKVYCHAR